MEVDRNNAEQVAKLMTSFLNVASTPDVYKFVKTISEDHRTLQQCFTRLCVEWFRLLADTENYDLRNKASIDFAKQNKEVFDNASIPFI